ncbi:mechanosensitive ion channel family protein [Microbacterium elymi]|uniref:Mechanosensitive ion channel family protein n=1 Tax=Microbacterium elymi TaxID=2909587 RepID=A0ABY5NL32_9MICO|nr:mechanosensitive ion channel family protein [Microbacterium elymi]UUT35898.1 mechanosensitive ion channel family protein [Microbacterium elymi]
MDVAQFLPDTVTWGGILLTVAVLVAGWVLAGLARRGMRAVLSRVRGISPSGITIIARVTGYLIILLAVGIALVLMGADIQPVLAVVIVVVVVLALVLRGVADNFAAGVLIQSRRTVDVGDQVQVSALDETVVGRVLEANARAVVIVTADGRTIHVPNAKLLSDSVVNHSQHGTRRSEVQVRVARAAHSIDEVAGLVRDAIAAVPRVRPQEPVQTLVQDVSTDRVTLRVWFWHSPTRVRCWSRPWSVPSPRRWMRRSSHPR